MINQQLVRAFLLGALLVPAGSVAMKQQDHAANDDWDMEAELKDGPYLRHDDNPEKPTFTQVCVEESLRIAPYAIPLVVAGYYTLPRLISPVTDYVKENASYLGKNAALMAWNSFIFYNLSQKHKERMAGDPRPDKRSCAGWFCLAPMINATAMTAASDSTLATATAWSIFGFSALLAAADNQIDYNDRLDLKKLDYEAHEVKNEIGALKYQNKSIESCGDPVFTTVLLSRQATVYKKFSAFKEHFNQLSRKEWVTPEQREKYNNIRDKYHRVMNNEHCPLNNKVVSSDLFENGKQQDINEN